MASSDDKEKLNLNLDEIIFQIFELFEKLLKARCILDALMKEGFINISKARYTAGIHSISSLNYNVKENTTARFKVFVEENDKKIDNIKLHDMNEKNIMSGLENLNIDDSIVRQRKTGQHNTNQALENKENVFPTSDKSDENELKSSHLCTDPLLWFGVLVPRNLKQSQKSFEFAVNKICEIADLQTQLTNLQALYKSKLTEKSVTVV